MTVISCPARDHTVYTGLMPLNQLVIKYKMTHNIFCLSNVREKILAGGILENERLYVRHSLQETEAVAF